MAQFVNEPPDNIFGVPQLFIVVADNNIHTKRVSVIVQPGDSSFHRGAERYIGEVNQTNPPAGLLVDSEPGCFTIPVPNRDGFLQAGAQVYFATYRRSQADWNWQFRPVGYDLVEPGGSQFLQ